MTKPTRSSPPATNQPRPRIEVVGFGTCPRLPEALRRTREAVKTLGFPCEVVPIDQALLDPGDPRRLWPSPTILANGRDVLGMEKPTCGGPMCRVYPGGLPGVDTIGEALRRAG